MPKEDDKIKKLESLINRLTFLVAAKMGVGNPNGKWEKEAVQLLAEMLAEKEKSE